MTTPITLITYAGAASSQAAAVTRIGGVPLAGPGTAWPTCAECAGPLKFLAQIRLDASGSALAGRGRLHTQLLVLFACQNRSGWCQDWHPASGANLALVVPARGLRRIPRPRAVDGEKLFLGAAHAAEPQVLADAADYDGARAAWAARTGRRVNDVLGQLGGTPAWLQYDETPACRNCAEPMRLAVQLQEGPDPVTAMNFGTGRGYAFTCGPCAEATFLWQC
ncbi:hypothetical protein ACFV2Q_07040 [Streptomyces sp. NPDC059650]|uniref:hypothetical protein n=1 Tax=Streptomyces sp. NPDC059650 TaxID=3346896 RepID=UPI0036A69D3E